MSTEKNYYIEFQCSRNRDDKHTSVCWVVWAAPVGTTEWMDIAFFSSQKDAKKAYPNARVGKRKRGTCLCDSPARRCINYKK